MDMLYGHQRHAFPKRLSPYRWVMISNDISEVEIEKFLDRQNRRIKKTSQHEPCQVCPMRFTEHAMHYVLYACNSPICISAAESENVSPCSWFLRTTMCDVSKRGTIEKQGHHLSSRTDESTNKLNLTTKRFIREKRKDKFTPSRILNAMIDEGLITANAQALLRPVQSYAYGYRTRSLGDNNDVDDLENKLASRQFHSSLPENASFGFGFETGESGKPSLSVGSAERPVVIGFATKKSLRNLAFAEFYPLHVDATFKLNTAGFPTVVIGVSDVQRRFHPVAFFIVSDIRHKQLESVFRETFKMYERP